MKHLPTTVALLCWTVAGSAVLGWVFGPSALIERLSAMMKPNAALSLTLLSASVYFSARGRELASKLLATVAIAIGLATLSEYFLGLDLGIDQLLRKDAINAESLAFPGRMAPNTAGLLVLLGAALVLVDRRRPKKPYVAQPLLIIVALVAYLSLIGYLYQATALYQVSNFIRISEYSATVFALLSIATLFSQPDRGAIKLVLSGGPEGYLLRRLLPTALLLPVALTWIIMQLRNREVLNRPTAFSLLAFTLSIVLCALLWKSASTLKRIEEKRVEGQDRLKKILEAARVAAWDFDESSGRIVRSDNHDPLFGIATRKPEWRLVDLERALHPEDRERTLGTFAAAVERGGQFSLEFRVVWPDGSIHWLTALAEATGQPGGARKASGILMDSTEKKRSEIQLRQALSTRDNFLSIASHELKTPITSLSLQSQILLRKVGSGAEVSQTFVKSHADLTLRSLERLTRLIEDMLDISRISSGKLTLDPAPLDLGELAKETLERFAPQLEAVGTSPYLQAQPGVVGHWDRFRLEQVLTNLLTNAIRYAAGKPLRVEVERFGELARLSVTDQGRGIAKEDQARIFQRFERLSASDLTGGLGLGLYISREIVEAHRGRIRVESEIGRGSRFVVELPMRSG